MEECLFQLTEQLSHNRKITSTLQAQAGSLRTQAAQTATGFSLRRFNTDISKEFFDSEQERVNARNVIENQTLLHENKQLSQLLKEHESAMDTVMSKFRNHALAAQQHELTLTRHYETLLLSRESQGMAGESVSNAHVSYSLQRLSHHLRDLIYSMAGESAAHDSIHHPDFDPDDEPVDFIDMSELLELLDQMEIKAGGGYPGTDDNRQDWAVEREYEISRLENENEELRRMLGIDAESIRNAGVDMEAEVANMAPPRHPGLSERYHSMQDSGDRWEVRPSYWDANGGGDGGDGGVNSQPFHPPPPPPPQQQLQQQQQMNTSGARLQRAVELPGGAGMRLPQGRRPGIFGAGQQRGALNAGTGRGISAISVPSPQSGLWSNLPPSPAPILADRVTIDRPWQLQTGSNLDLSR